MTTNQKKLAVIAVGGNSLITSKDKASIEDQYENVVETCRHIADIIEMGFEVVVTHGNGPQVGYILERSEAAKKKVHEVPMDTAGADTQGAIGYAIQQALQNELRRRGIKKGVATVVTQVLVSKDDPSFKKPSKPIGPFYSEADAKDLEAKRGWAVVEDSGRGWRRVVPSPIPVEIVELAAVRSLIDAGIVTVSVGGGGIPVIREDNGNLKGVAAVIDKDRASSMLASVIGATHFVICTAVEKVCLNFGKPDQKNLDDISIADAERYMGEGHFKPGSMLPKVEAAVQFLKKGGQQVIITSPEMLGDAVKGHAGTRILA